jgi:hypothetical protein
MDNTIRKRLSIFLLLALWIPQLIVYLLPVIIGIDHSIDIDAENIPIDAIIVASDNSFVGQLLRVLSEPIYYLFIILGGLLVTFLMYIGVRRWNVLLIIITCLYLISWYFAGSTGSLPIDMAYQLKWKLAVFTKNYFNFFFHDVYLPLVNAVILFLFSVRMIWGQPNESGSE